MIKVTSELMLYEIDDDSTARVGGPTMKVSSHVAKKDLVVLFVEGTKVSVLASDLQAAIVNATNTGSSF